MIESANPVAQRTRETRALIAAGIVTLMALTQLNLESEARMAVLGVQSVIGLAAFAIYLQNDRTEPRKKTVMQVLFFLTLIVMLAAARGVSMILT